MSIREKLPQRYPYELNRDAEKGFADAVHNNQITLGMYYMIEIVANLQEELDELRGRLEDTSENQAKKTSKKSTKKKTAEVAESEGAEE